MDDKYKGRVLSSDLLEQGCPGLIPAAVQEQYKCGGRKKCRADIVISWRVEPGAHQQVPLEKRCSREQNDQQDVPLPADRNAVPLFIEITSDRKVRNAHKEEISHKDVRECAPEDDHRILAEQKIPEEQYRREGVQYFVRGLRKPFVESRFDHQNVEKSPQVPQMTRKQRLIEKYEPQELSESEVLRHKRSHTAACRGFCQPPAKIQNVRAQKEPEHFHDLRVYTPSAPDSVIEKSGDHEEDRDGHSCQAQEIHARFSRKRRVDAHNKESANTLENIQTAVAFPVCCRHLFPAPVYVIYLQREVPPSDNSNPLISMVFARVNVNEKGL